MNESAFIRCFIAIDINADVRRRLSVAQARLKAVRAKVSWVPAENLHLSVAFLGDVPREQVSSISDVLDAAARGKPALMFAVEGVGTFGGGSPRVIWGGVEPNEALATLYGEIRNGLQQLGFDLDDRPYRPHVTLGRVRSSRGRTALVAELAHVRDTFFGHVTAEGVDLMMSTLGPAGAHYDRLHRARLG